MFRKIFLNCLSSSHRMKNLPRINFSPHVSSLSNPVPQLNLFHSLSFRANPSIKQTLDYNYQWKVDRRDNYRSKTAGPSNRNTIHFEPVNSNNREHILIMPDGMFENIRDISPLVKSNASLPQSRYRKLRKAATAGTSLPPTNDLSLSLFRCKIQICEI